MCRAALPPRAQIEKVDPRSGLRQRAPCGEIRQQVDAKAGKRGSKTPDWPRETDARLRDHVRRIESAANDRSDSWHKHRCRGRDPEMPQHRDVPHLVYVDGRDNAERPLPTE